MVKQAELQKFADYVRLTWDRALTTSTGGNMSIRIGDNVYITPTMFIKHFFTVEDIVITDMDGKQLGGKYRASSEIKMHLNIYKIRKDVTSIFHAHPKNGLVCAINKIKINTHILPEAVFMLEEISYISYNQPGTANFAKAFTEDAKKGCNVFVLENHGVTTCGNSIETAFARLETLETCSYLSVIQELMGKKPNCISLEEIKKIIS